MDENEPNEGYWFVLGMLLYAIPAVIIAALIASPVILVLAAVFIGITKS